jgi:hypothetical protein
MSFVVIVVSLVPVATGIAYIEMVPEHMASILMILVPISTMMAGVIFTYSIAQYTLQKRFRHLVLIFFAVNMMITGIFYFLTNASMTPLSPFAGRERNRTIVAAFALVLAPSILSTGVSAEIDFTKKRMILAILWGGLLSPLVTLWFMFSPEPVFLTTFPGGGLTPAAYLILMLLIPLWSVALWRYYSAWKLERNRLDLAAFLSIILWAYAVSLFVLQSDPYQLMEIIWFSVFLSGELLLTIVTVTTQIIEPQKELSNLVETRTDELIESKKEIEFYLNIWGHKIGNLLQSMVLYLEMFSSGEKSTDELTNLSITALDIGNEANQINRQVAALIKLKAREDYELSSVNLNEMITTTLGIVESTYGSHCVQEPSGLFTDTMNVRGDEFIELALENLFAFICKQYPETKIRLTTKVDDESVSLMILYTGPRIPKDVEDSLFSLLQPARTTLSLDLFTVKILMQRFEGFFLYDWLDKSDENQFTLKFKRVEIERAEPILHSEFSETPDH